MISIRSRICRRAAWSASTVALGLTLVLSVAVTLPVHAWDATGHRIVAQIAWDRLSPSARSEANAVLESIELDFVDASTWLDEVRGNGVRLFDRWHYINQPTDASTVDAPRAHADNVLWAIARARDGIAAHEAPRAARAFALATLIHVVGDVHQPLHVVSRYDERSPRGDRGGNDFTLPDPWGTLHRLWDRMAGLVQPPDAPRSRIDDKAIRAWAARLNEKQAAQQVDANLDPNAWAAESKRLANAAVYADIQPGTAPSAAYLERTQGVAEEQLVRAGRRLAAMVEDALTLTSPTP